MAGLRHALLAAAVALVAIPCATRRAHAAPLGVNLYGVSYHFDRKPRVGDSFNEANLGAGLDWVVWRSPHQTVFADAGIFRDSFRHANRFADLAWTHSLIGPVQGGVALVISSSSSIGEGEPFMAPVPMLCWRADRFAVNFVYLMRGTNINEYPSLGAYATIYPFGPVPAGRPGLPGSRSGGRAAGSTGIEYAVGPSLQLRSFDGASLSVRRRVGQRGWRLGVDLGALTHRDYRLSEPAIGERREFRRDVQRFNLETRAQRLFHGAARGGISGFGGIGPILGYTNYDPSGMRRWRLGAAGTCGVEWHVARRVSVAAEYGLDLVYASARSEALRSPTLFVERKSREVSLDARGVRLGVTAWLH